MKSMIRTLGVLASLLTAGAASAQELPAAKVQQLREAIRAQTQGTVAVDAISGTPISGIYQVASDGEIFYTDESGRYSFVSASLIDMREKKDLTAASLDKLNAVPWSSLPLQHAVKEVHGKGTQKMAVFEDPNCPICRVFTKFLDQVEDVTIYRFMYPVISPQSEGLARQAWCASDRSTAWKNIMNGARPQGAPTCDAAGLTAILKFGEKHRIHNTPTVVLASGKRLVGATPPEQFIQELAAGGR